MEHPRGVYFLSIVEMWERFSYYGIRAILVLFMTKALMFSTKDTGTTYGWFTGLTYLFPLIGGYIADKYWGRSKAIIVGCTLITLGQFFMTYASIYLSLFAFYSALALVVVGTGFFKPNIAAAAGTFYEQNDPRRDGGFTIFYMGANLGAFIAPLICGSLGERVGWSYGFASAGIGMMIGLATFLWGKDKFLSNKVTCHFNEKEKTEDVKTPLTKQEKERIAVIFIMMFFVIFFWSAFEQTGSSLMLFADRSTNRVLPFFNINIPASLFQSLNPFFIFIFAPVFSGLWTKLANINNEPATVYKFVWALGFVALGFVLMVFAVMANEKYGPVSMLWLIGVYFFHTIGELCLAPVGLSMVTKLAPAKFVSLMMGTWFLAYFIANTVSGFFAGNYDSMDHKKFFMIPIITAGTAAISLFLIAKPIRKWMHGVH